MKRLLLCLALLLTTNPGAFALSSDSASTLSVNLKEKKLPVLIKVPSRCMFGDYDAIFQDYTYSKKDYEILLTVSPFGSKKIETAQVFKELFSHALKIDATNAFQQKERFDLYRKLLEKEGEQVSVKVPVDSVSNLYELKICKNSDLKNRNCEAKAATDVNKVIFRQYKDQNASVPDSLYFHQYFKLEGDKVVFLKPGLKQKELEQLEAKFSKEKGLADHKIIKSLQLEKAGESLLVKLPAADPARCN